MSHPAGTGSSRRLLLDLLLSSLLVVTPLAGCGESGSKSACEAGTFGPGDGDCVACAPGTYCPAGSEAPVDCAANGEWDDDADPSTECAAVTACTASEWESMAPTATSDRVCAAVTECTASEWEATAPTASSDRVCAPFTVCLPGQYVSAAGTETSDQVCTGCTSGTFSTEDDATSCAAWTTCIPGEYVSTPGSAASDQVCMPCASGTYTDGPNQSTCVSHDACAPGTVQTAAGDATTPPTCEACSAGTHCAGGEAPVVLCDDGDGTWDHDGDPATACVARTDCAAGTYVSSEGDALSDRSCTACAAGFYSTTQNAPECTAWTSCAPGDYVSTPGSSTADRTCVPEWIRQFGTALIDEGWSVSVDGDGNVLVAGFTAGTLPGESSAGGRDAFVRKYAPDGALLWTRQFGTAEWDQAESVSVDADGGVLVAGTTGGSLPGESSAGGNDAFVRKYAPDGALLWTRQFGTASADRANSVSVDVDGNVLVAGSTDGTLPGESSAGGTDAFVRKYDGDGNVLWTRQFGTASGDVAYSVSVDVDGGVLVAGRCAGTLPGQTSAGGFDAFVRKYAPDGALLWTRQFGTASWDQAESVSVDGEGNVLVAGTTDGTLPEETSAGGWDAFVRKYAPDGALLWTRQFGTASTDVAYSVSVDVDGNVLVAGHTDGTMPGESSAGGIDAFVRKCAPDGTPLWTRQFGTASTDAASSVSVDADGNVLVAGYTDGTLPGQTSAGGRDAFVTKLASP